MSEKYVRLADSAIFKARYGEWFLIDTSLCERERILINGGAEKVLLFLFRGNTISETCKRFRLRSEELIGFLYKLCEENTILFSQVSVDSTTKCHDINPPLDSVNVLLTNICNLRCAHCYVSSGKPMRGELTGKEWIRVLQEARQIGVFELNVSGGEATLHRDFIQIAEYIGSVPTFNANLNTNGVVLRPEYEEVVAKTFTSIQVSIDNIVPELHDAFRGRAGSFNRSMRTIERLISRGVETNIGFTLTRDSLDSIDRLVEFAEKIGVTTLNIGLVADIGRAEINGLVHKVSPDSVNGDLFMEQVYQKMRDLAARQSHLQILLPFRVGDSDKSAREKEYICDGDNTQILYIMADGSMMPCDKLPIEQFTYGNIRETSLLETWMSQKMKDFKLMSSRHLPKCGSCPHLKICGGACVARAFQIGGSLESPDWTSCVIAQKFVRDMAQTTK